MTRKARDRDDRALLQGARARGEAPAAPALDEEQLIARFLAPFPKGERVVVGPGSDCAAVSVARGQKVISTTDAVVEGVHFDWRWFSPEQVGHKALAVNLSDLAAAGARPRWFLCALGIPNGSAGRARRSGSAALGSLDLTARAEGIAHGMAKLAKRFGCALIGGNVTRAREWSITIAALGESPRPLSRTGARPGDALVVCGKLGAAAAGLRALRENGGASRSAPGRAEFDAQRTPEPLVEAGLLARGIAHAGIDVSDGFLRDLERLCAASRVGVQVDRGALPIARGASLGDALTGGEDYALLWAVPERKLARLKGAWTRVGTFQRGNAVVLSEGGEPRPQPRRKGFDHLG